MDDAADGGPRPTGGSLAEELPRCAWATGDPLLLNYHDEEWGVPVRDDRLPFEFLVLEGAQAGLSWLTVLRKRDAYRRAFLGFDPERVASFGSADIALLLAETGLIRNRVKLEAAVTNARAVLRVQQTYGTFAAYVWSFVGGETIHNRWKLLAEIPTNTGESELMSRRLKRRGFRFVGPTICYAFMQATGMVNDHTVACFRWHELEALRVAEQFPPGPRKARGGF